MIILAVCILTFGIEGQAFVLFRAVVVRVLVVAWRCVFRAFGKSGVEHFARGC